MKQISSMEEYALNERLKREEASNGFWVFRVWAFLAFELIPFFIKRVVERKKPPKERTY